MRYGEAGGGNQRHAQTENDEKERRARSRNWGLRGAASGGWKWRTGTCGAVSAYFIDRGWRGRHCIDRRLGLRVDRERCTGANHEGDGNSWRRQFDHSLGARRRTHFVEGSRVAGRLCVVPQNLADGIRTVGERRGGLAGGWRRAVRAERNRLDDRASGTDDLKPPGSGGSRWACLERNLDGYLPRRRRCLRKRRAQPHPDRSGGSKNERTDYRESRAADKHRVGGPALELRWRPRKRANRNAKPASLSIVWEFTERPTQ